ncbi:MAG: ATP-binding cassette domain-containing protein [Candidatus Aminicenantes bacterium]|nr:ATP-binding cassette domain-containing protein [Candidatus Aminicenantes bacterium]
MIEVRKLCKSFNGKKVLNKIDLEIHENEIFTILGPSGHGKTVLIKLLVRLLEPDSGSISYDGQDISSLSKREFNEMYKKIAFIFQSNALFDYLDVKDNLSLYKKLHTKLSEKMIMDEVLEAIHFVGLGQDVLNKFPEELSEGMKKRVAIARAVIKLPSYIFYDEPTLGLDQGNIVRVIELIRSLKKDVSLTSIVVTHNIHLMFEISDRVALLKDREIVFVGDKDNISNVMLQNLYEKGEDYEL